MDSYFSQLIQEKKELLLLAHEITSGLDLDAYEFKPQVHGFHKDKVYPLFFAIRCRPLTLERKGRQLALTVHIIESYEKGTIAFHYRGVEENKNLTFINPQPNFEQSLFENFSFYFMQSMFYSGATKLMEIKEEPFIDCYLETRLFDQEVLQKYEF